MRRTFYYPWDLFGTDDLGLLPEKTLPVSYGIF